MAILKTDLPEMVTAASAPLPVCAKTDLSLPHPTDSLARVLRLEWLRQVFSPTSVDWVEVAAQARGAPPHPFALIALLVVAETLVTNSRRVQPRSDWKEVPIIRGVLVGDPTSGKSPAIDAVMNVVSELQAELIVAYGGRLPRLARAERYRVQWKEQVKAAQPARAALPLRPEQASAPPEPVRERITVSDATIEKAAKIMSQSGRALLMLRDELAGWLGVMGRYDSGGDLGFVLEAYGGRAYDVDRKSLSTPLLAGSLRIGVLGSIQPVRMDRYLLMPEDDDLLPRCLVAYPDPVPIARPKKQIDNAYLKRALIRLFALPSPASAERPDQTGVGDFHGRQPQRRWTTFAGSAANARHR